MTIKGRGSLRSRMIGVIILVLLLVGCGGKQDIAAGLNQNDDKFQEKQLDTLEDKRIGVLTGSAGDSAARQRFPRAQIFDLDNIVNATSALRSNKIDAIVYERTTLQEIAKKKPDLKVIEESVQIVDVAIAIKKGNLSLLNSVNQVITDLESNGTLDEMKVRWFTGSNLSTMPKLDSPFSQETLHVGTEALMPPFEFIDAGNQLSGFDIELAGRIGQSLGKKIVVSNMNFTALIPALQSGKIDLAISCFNITGERRQRIDFSRPYHASDIAVMIRKPGGSSLFSNTINNIKTSFHSNIITEQRYLLIVGGLKITVIISLLSVFFGTLLGALVCLLRMAKNRYLNAIARVYISILRGIPVLVLLMIIFYVVFTAVNINPVLVAVLYFAISWLLALTLDYIGFKTDPKRNRG